MSVMCYFNLGMGVLWSFSVNYDSSTFICVLISSRGKVVGSGVKYFDSIHGVLQFHFKMVDHGG